MHGSNSATQPLPRSTSTCLVHHQECSRRNHACCDRSRACSRGVIAHQSDNATVSISASATNDAISVTQASHQEAQSLASHNATASISALPTNSATSVPQASSPTNDATSALQASHQRPQLVTVTSMPRQRITLHLRPNHMAPNTQQSSHL